MNSDRFRECRHILASQENLERLPGFAQTPSIQEAAEVITRSRPKAVVRQCVSHLPIPPPIWAQLPTDIITGSILSHRLPEVFPFDSTARCSCGNSNYNAEAHTMTTSTIIHHIVNRFHELPYSAEHSYPTGYDPARATTASNKQNLRASELVRPHSLE